MPDWTPDASIWWRHRRRSSRYGHTSRQTTSRRPPKSDQNPTRPPSSTPCSHSPPTGGGVLTPHGSIAIELGDTYAGSGGAGGDYNAGGIRGGQQKFTGSANRGGKNGRAGSGEKIGGHHRGGHGWPAPKSLALIPQLYACSLAYGRNLLTGQPSPAGQWLIRNIIVWHRPNPAGAPPLDTWFDHDDHDTWTITTQPSRLSHYAMWPPKMAERIILSMCPAEVCLTCGEPRRRIEEKTPAYRSARAAIGDFKSGHDRGTGLNGTKQHHDGNHIERADTITLGWTDCGHDNYRAGVVLDPFAGTGTTLCVADLHGRDGIGFDIDPRNANLVEPRMAEVRRNLHGVTPELPGQLDMFTPSTQN